MKCQIEKVPSHIKYLDQQITPLSREKSAWILNATEETPVVLIRKPTASNLSHRLLNPFIYRNIESVGTLDDLATLLDTPDDWKVRYNQVVADGILIYTTVRVVPQDIVARIEDEISIQEKKEYQKQESEVTLL